ncbi:alpha/beta hydrolase [Yoonia sp. BS5-3]|uniref:Alpha/beta fold hydrolase n=1 Tax=Yoonia phaeophyticola TaxID=3137369 RepID=A0ABZ2VAP2_9RHOB
MWFWGFLLIVLLVAFAPAIIERLRQTIGPKQRAGADGDFAQLSQGITHYKWVGPVRGPVAVLIHGLTSPSIALEGVAEGLGKRGYRVLTYDLYGRGLSDAAPGLQDRAFFLRQLTDLLDHLGLTEEITCVGYSMGGAIATAFAAQSPHRINRVILFATAGVETVESDFSKFCRNTPVLGDWVYGLVARGRILGQIPTDSANPYVERVLDAQRQELKRQGYLPAVLSSRRGMLAESMEKDHRKLGREDVPVVAIWAEQDEVIPISALGTLAQWNRLARQEVVAKADHAVPYTHPQELLDAVANAMRD